MAENYWTRQQRALVSRRRLLQGTGAGAAAALFLAACGGSNNNNSKPATSAATGTRAASAAASSAGAATPGGAVSAPSAATQGAATPAVAATQAKKGGTLRERETQAFTPLDPYRTGASTHSLFGAVYSSLMHSHPVASPYPSTAMDPDAAQSYETPDPTTYNFKLRPNVRFTPPIDRLMTSEDVNFSWQRFNGKAPGTQPSVAVGNLSNIDTLTTPDASSVVIKLKAPDASTLNRLGDEYNLLLMPKETGTAFDPTKTLVGSGPWMFVSTDPNVTKFKRNPTWHFGPDLPYMDAVEGYTFTDFAPALTQFQGNNLDLLQGFQHADDYKTARDNIKGLQFQPVYTPFMAYVSFQMNDKSGQWQDPRVRQAISMSLDRNAIFEAVYDVSTFKSLGITIPVVQHNFMPAGFGPDWWVDPNGSKIDPAVKPFFQYDPQGAKQLLTAAGFPNGFSVNYHYTSGFGPDFAKAAELSGEYINKIGIKLNVIVEDANSVYFPKTFLGMYDGIAYQYEGLSTPQETLSLMYLPGGSRNHSNVNDPDVTAQINAFVAEQDPNKAHQLAYDFQNKMGQKFYYVPDVYNAGPSFTGAWPYVGGFGQWNALRTGLYSVSYSHYGINK